MAMAKAAKATAKPVTKVTTLAHGWVDRLGALAPAEMDELRERMTGSADEVAAAVASVRAHVCALAGAAESDLQAAWLQGVEAAYVLQGQLPATDDDFAAEPRPVQQAFLAGLRGRSLRASIAEALPLPGEPEGSAMTRGLRGMARRMGKGKK